MINEKKWGTQLKIYIRRSGLTVSDFSQRLSNLLPVDKPVLEATIYQYQSGRVPKDRERHLLLLKVLISAGGIGNPVESNSWLESGGQGLLTQSERRDLFPDYGFCPDKVILRPDDDLDVQIPNPYKGLVSYEERDKDLFFGREKLVTQLVGRIESIIADNTKANFLGIVGASGSGKSSIIQAGLIPELRTFHKSITLIKPTKNPLQELALSLTAHKESVSAAETLMEDMANSERSLLLFVARELNKTSGTSTKLILVIDQFEEIFTLSEKKDERDMFIKNLMYAVYPDSQGQIMLIISLRADFYHFCTPYEELRWFLSQQQVYIGTMTEDELHQAIEKPALVSGVTIEAALLDQLFEDISNEPGQLPLLSHALRETWKEKRGRQLTLVGYRKVGGIRQAVTRTADNQLKAFDDRQLRIVRNVFTRLTALGEGSEDTRRSAELSEFFVQGRDDKEVITIIAKLADARLVVTSFSKDPDDETITVEVVHEALIREWGQLREWLEEDRDMLRLRERLRLDTSNWLKAGCDSHYLLRKNQLIPFEVFEQADHISLSRREWEFLNASRKREAFLRNRNMAFGIFSFCVALVLLVLVFRTVSAQNEAAINQRVAQSGVKAANAMVQLTHYPYDALPNALEAITITRSIDGSITFAASNALYHILNKALKDGTLFGHSSNVTLAIYSPDGFQVLTSSTDGTARTWDISGNPEAVLGDQGERVNSITYDQSGGLILTAGENGIAKLWDRKGQLVQAFAGHDALVNTAYFSPDALLVLTSSADKSARIWDVEGNLIAILEGHDDEVNSAVFNPDSSLILTGSSDNTARLWALDGQTISILEGHNDRVTTAVFSPDGSLILTASDDGTARIWDIDGKILATLEGHEDRITNAVFSPKGDLIATSSADQTARLWDLSGQELHVLTGHSFIVHSVSFDPQGQLIATAGQDNTVRLWNTDGQLVNILTGHGFDVRSAVFSPDGRSILTGSNDDTARIWHLEGHPFSVLADHTSLVTKAVYSPDGELILTASNDGTAILWDKHGRLITVLDKHEEWVRSAAFSPDGQTILTISDDGTARVWDRQGNEISILEGHTDAVVQGLFSPDGKQILTASNDTTARLWDLMGNELAVLAGHKEKLWSAAFSSDGQYIVTGSDDGAVILWQADGRFIKELKQHDTPVQWVTFYPQSDRIISADNTGLILIWDLNGKILGELKGHEGIMNSVAFSPDGSKILTTSRDDTARLWDASGQLLAVLEDHVDDVNKAIFSPDGTRIVTISRDKTIWIWDDNGKPLAILEGHGVDINSVAFNPDGTRFVTASDDGTARIWTSFLDFDSMIEGAIRRKNLAN